MQNKHTLIYFLGRGVPGLVSFLAVTIYTRLILPDEYGKYALVIATVSLLNMILFQWIRISLLRHLPQIKTQEQAGRLYASIALGFVCSTLISGISALIYYFVFNPDKNIVSLLLLGYVLLLMEAFFELNLEYFRSSLKPLKYSTAFFVKAVCAVTCGSALAYYKYGSIGLLSGVLVADLTVAIVFFRDFLKKLLSNLSYFDKSNFIKLLLYGLPMTVSFAMIFIINSSDRYFINYYLGQSATGMYSVGYDFSNNSLIVIMSAINLASVPLALRALENGGKAAADSQLELNLILLLSISIPATFGVCCLADRISTIFIGKNYVSEAVTIIPFISLAALVSGIKNYYIDISFQLGNKSHLQMWSVGAAAIVNVVLNLIWIPTIGIMGAIYSTIIAYALALLISFILSRSCYKLPIPWIKCFKILFSAAVMGIYIIIIKKYCFGGLLGLAVIILTASVLYFLLLYILKIIKLTRLQQIFMRS